jgi:hypothetical protein
MVVDFVIAASSLAIALLGVFSPDRSGVSSVRFAAHVTLVTEMVDRQMVFNRDGGEN